MVDEEVEEIVGRECVGKQSCSVTSACAVALRNLNKKRRRKKQAPVELANMGFGVTFEYDVILVSVGSF